MQFSSVQRYLTTFRLNSTSAYYYASTDIIIIIIIIIVEVIKLLFFRNLLHVFQSRCDGRTSLAQVQSFFEAHKYSHAVHRSCLSFSSISLKSAV